MKKLLLVLISLVSINCFANDEKQKLQRNLRCMRRQENLSIRKQQEIGQRLRQVREQQRVLNDQRLQLEQWQRVQRGKRAMLEQELKRKFGNDQTAPSNKKQKKK